MKTIALSISLFLSSFLLSQNITNGNDVINAMYKKYDGGKRWYKYFSFTQDAIFYRNDSAIKTEVWHEIGSFPGHLAIKYDTKDSKDGVIFAVNKVYGIKDGVAKEPRTFIHDLILVGFDLYFLNPERSAHLLDSLGYNLKEMHTGVFEGRKVYVVGAKQGDEKTPQFWIDAERLYMHRIIYKKKDNITDCVFGDYEKVDGNWVAKKCIFKQNGVLQLIEKYYDLKFPKELSPDIFNPEKFAQIKW
jgi:hypothetical protein